MQKNLNETNDERKLRLEIETSTGKRYSEAYENLFKEFIEEAEYRLFMAFKQTDPSDKDTLQVIRLQLAAYNSLQNHLKAFVDTGTLADIEMAGEVDLPTTE